MIKTKLIIGKTRFGDVMEYELWKDGKCICGLIGESKVNNLIKQVNPTVAYKNEELVYQTFSTKPNQEYVDCATA
jgi:hypothetical protein